MLVIQSYKKIKNSKLSACMQNVKSYINCSVCNACVMCIHSFPGNEEGLNPPPNKKVCGEMIAYHRAYDNAKNKCGLTNEIYAISIY